MVRLKAFDSLPLEMQNDSVKQYYEILSKKKASIFLKRVFDLVISLLLTVIISPVLLILAIMIKCDSKGPVLFRQTRVTTNNKKFRICKFRTMVQDAESKGAKVTSGKDSRITKVGSLLRKTRLDELPQLFNVIAGDMSFVGTRPEVPEYVAAYSDEMYATLLLPAGITSKTSLCYKNEDEVLAKVAGENPTASQVSEAYIKVVLPEKMKINLESLKEFSLFEEIKIMLRTALVIIGK